MINFTRQDNSSVLTVQFKEILAMQKYLQTPYLAYVKQYSLYVQQLIGVRNNLLIWSAVVFAVIFIGCFLAIWRPILGRLLERLKITRQILGWIPMRALAKNKRLTA